MRRCLWARSVAEPFTPQGRAAVLDALVGMAREDEGVVSAALVGSAARGEEDRWSDIDLVLGVAADPEAVARRWTAVMYASHGAVHHLDVLADGVLYRVFLLPGALQVDISFWPRERIRATEPGFRLLFGEANAPTRPRGPDPGVLVGWAWLYALHARSAIARGRTWQAVLMLDELRGQVVALACARHGLPSYHGRGVDRLPAAFQKALAAAEVSGADAAGLRRRASVLLDLLEAEVAGVDAGLAERIAPSLALLVPPEV